MHITWMATQSAEDPSGLGRFLPLARQTIGLGHRVSYVALHPAYADLPAEAREQVAGGVEIRYVAQSHVLKRGSSKVYFSPPQLLRLSLAGAVALAREIRRMRPDLIHVAKPQPINGLALAWLGFPRFFLDCDDYEAASNRFSGRWQRKIVSLFEDALPRRAALLTTNTTFMRERLLRLQPRQPHLIPNSVERERFAGVAALSRREARCRLGLPDAPIVLYVGSLSLASHAVDLLIRAFAGVLAQAPQARLVLVGGGEDGEQMKQLAASLGLATRAVFAGRVPPSQVPQWLRAADVTVDPEIDDDASRARSPLKVLESLAARTPCVAGDVGDRRCMLPAEWLVQPGDPGALAHGIIRALHDPGEPTLLDARDYTRRANKFLRFWDDALDDLADVYGTATQ